MKKLLFILLFSISLFADTATKSDIRESNRLLIEIMKLNQENINKRFEQVDKRFENMIKFMDKRFEQVDKRFEDMNKKFDNILYVMIAGFTIILGYLLKERVILSESIKKDLSEELKEKADKKTLDKVLTVIEELAKKDNSIKELLEKHNLILKVQ